MLVVDLHCAHGHHFEGWFASSDDLASQQARGLVTCPVCGAGEVTRRPSAPHLNVSHLRAPEVMAQADRAATAPAVAASPAAGADGVPSVTTPAQAIEALQAMYLQAVRHVVAHTEDVGARFAEEARSIHHGDAPERPIRGQSTPEEREELRDEGIEVMSLSIPESLKGPLQ